MKIYLWGINYEPELTGIGPYNAKLCNFLKSKGHHVEVVTAFSYYPNWKKQSSDKKRFFRTEIQQGIPIHRCWLYVPDKLSAFKRVIHELSFSLSSFLRLFFLSRPDAIIVVSPPLLLGTMAAIFSQLKRCAFIFHVQDLQPDAAVNLGMVKKGHFVKILYWLEKFAYRKANLLSGISQGMVNAFLSKGINSSKLVIFPNSIKLPSLSEITRLRGRFRQRNQYSTKDILLVYSGNFGIKQGLDIILDAASLISNKRVHFVLCGEGAQRDHLLKRIQNLKLTNVRVFSLLPLDEYHELLADADICVITQQRGSGAAFFPSKLLHALAYRRPILSVADQESELAKAVAFASCGINVLPGKAKDFANVVEEISNGTVSLSLLAHNGRYYVEQFQDENVHQDFYRHLIRLQQNLEFNSSPKQVIPSLTFNKLFAVGKPGDEKF
jgi:colanic acid biosynthesis glycosyl transferase WcaI